MAESWHIRNGRILDPASGTDEAGDLLIVDGRIATAGQEIPSDIQIVDAEGCWVTPGLIDMHVHLREPGAEYKEDVHSGARAAAAGGFTAVACMPNTEPVNDCKAVCMLLRQQARTADARIYPIGAISRGLSGEGLAEYGELRHAGAVGVTDDGRPVQNSQLMRRALEYASDFGLAVISHCEDPGLANGVMNEGQVSTRLGLKGIPAACESIMVYRDIALAEYTGKPVHIAHVSCAQAVDLIREAKARGVKVTAETAPHYFTLTDAAVTGYDTNAKMNPPLRSEVDRQAILRALADGTLDAIATDHAPHSVLEKEVEFDAAANGIIGLETSLPLTLRLVREGTIAPLRMIELMSTAPASILNIPGGRLHAGMPADVTIIDPKRSFTYTRDRVVSKSCNTPFLDWEFTGCAVLTLMGGRATHNVLNA